MERQPDPIAAVAFMHEHGMTRLLALLRERYAALSGARGQARLTAATVQERREIASWLGRPLPVGAAVVVKLAEFEHVLQQSRFACTLAELLTAAFPDDPLVTRVERHALAASAQQRFLQSLHSIEAGYAPDTPSRSWLADGEHGSAWLASRYRQAHEDERAHALAVVAAVAQCLDAAPWSDTPARLAIFARNVLGDPHALDRTTETGRLFLLALADLAATLAPTWENVVGERQRELHLYEMAGLQVDMISSTVAVLNLMAATLAGGAPDPLAALSAARVLVLPLQQIIAWEGVTASGDDIYVVENPPVFEEIAAARPAVMSGPTLICTAGWPSAAALLLLDKVVAQALTARLHYSGDFDLAGLRIAAYLLARYPGRCTLWRYDATMYAQAVHERATPAPAPDLAALATLPAAFGELAVALGERHAWAYQEGIVAALIADVWGGSSPPTSHRVTDSIE